ncbi:hypothetical protein NMY22_g18073 [Coprinellus aureogranulatus]|nr:hypothetical protein NMY22_g18073 [Coprinellus aureogranulatus]
MTAGWTVRAFLSLLSLFPGSSFASQSTLPSGSSLDINYGKCYENYVNVNVSALNYKLDITPPKDQEEVTDFVVRWTSENSNVTKEVVGEPVENVGTYKIYTVFCVPEKQDERKTVELAIHGINFDHTYWSFGGKGSKYNYAERALKAGHSILIYDRLGIGKSEKPDGIKEVQTPTEVEIAAELVKYLKSKPRGLEFDRYIGIGHSYGSVMMNDSDWVWSTYSAQLTGLASKYGNLLNATILTGFSSYLPSVIPAFATWTLTVAAEQNPKKFKGLPTTYVISNNGINDQQNFFTYGGYEKAVVGPAGEAKQPCTLGELLSILEPIPTDSPASAYTNPVLVVTGDKDYIFCGGDCYQQVNGVNLVEGTKNAYPDVPASDFSTYIPAKTGHGVNLHLSAPETFGEIQKWIAALA